MSNQFTMDIDDQGEKPVHSLDIPIDFSLKDKTEPKENIMAVLKFMKRLSDFEKRSAEKNFLVGRKNS